MTGRRISFSNDHRGNLRHNNREFVSENIDRNRMKDNITIVKQSLADAYQELFGRFVETYNQKQKRADRKIDDYYTKLFGKSIEDSHGCIVQNSNKQYNFYEYVVGVGDKNDTGFESNPDDAKVAVECLREYIHGFQERNPNFHIFNAVIHCDEATPHLHYDFIPYADGFKSGMSRQQGIARALSSMGYGTGVQAIANFTSSERDVFRKICESHGLKIATEEKGRGQTYSPEEYKKVQDRLQAELKPQIIEEMESKKQLLQTDVTKLEQKRDDLEKNIAEKVVIASMPIPSRPIVHEKEGHLSRIKKEKAITDWDKKYGTLYSAQEIICQKGKIITQAKIEADNTKNKAEKEATQVINEAENLKKDAESLKNNAEKQNNEASQSLCRAKEKEEYSNKLINRAESMYSDALNQRVKLEEEWIRTDPVLNRLYRYQEQNKLDLLYNQRIDELIQREREEIMRKMEEERENEEELGGMTR